MRTGEPSTPFKNPSLLPPAETEHTRQSPGSLGFLKATPMTVTKKCQTRFPKIRYEPKHQQAQLKPFSIVMLIHRNEKRFTHLIAPRRIPPRLIAKKNAETATEKHNPYSHVRRCVMSTHSQRSNAARITAPVGYETLNPRDCQKPLR